MTDSFAQPETEQLREVNIFISSLDNQLLAAMKVIDQREVRSVSAFVDPRHDLIIKMFDLLAVGFAH